MYSRGYLSCNIMGRALLDGSNVTFLLRSESRFKDLYSIPVVYIYFTTGISRDRRGSGGTVEPCVILESSTSTGRCVRLYLLE